MPQLSRYSIIIACLFLIVLTSVFKNGHSAKILAVFPIPAKSHYNLYSSLLKELVKKGHEVTVITPFQEKNPPEVWREVYLSGFQEHMQALLKNMKPYERTDENPFLNAIFSGYFMSEMVENTLAHSNVQKLIHSNEKFDLVIIEAIANEAHKALATHFGAPLVILSTIGANFLINPGVGCPTPLSYVPDSFLSFSVPMTFFERLYNTFFNRFLTLLYIYYTLPTQNKMIQKYIPNGPDIYDVYYNTSLVLLNSHQSTNQPVPYVPNMIDIGGYHIKAPKGLPRDLQEFLDNAPNGVIYFSMGSNLKSSELPDEKRDALLKVFSKLKQKVLWKWEDDTMPKQPKNVKLSKWLPQNDVLAHSNIKLFITHCGLLSTTETIYHGVPILAIPVFGDQRLNAKTAVAYGFGLMLEFRNLNEENLREKINEMLTNQKYQESAKARSKIFHDRVMKPMDTAIYWVEYVIRHKGAEHLKVAGLQLPFYQYFLLDVIFFIVVAFVAVLLILRYIFRRLFCRQTLHKNKKE